MCFSMLFIHFDMIDLCLNNIYGVYDICVLLNFIYMLL